MINFKDIVREEFVFPDGTYHCKVEPMDENVVAISGDLDIVKLATKVDAVRRNFLDAKILLSIPYIPSRQDRECDYGEPLTVKVVAELINSLGVEVVITLEPHSDVLPALINNCKVVGIEEVFVWEDIIKRPKVILVSPDGGAIKRTDRVCKHLVDSFPNINFSVLYCEKHRDPVSGKLTEIKVPDHTLEDDTQYIVVDDVCAMGGTFLWLRDELGKKVDSSCLIDIVLAHVDKERNGLDKLAEVYDNVHITNSQADFKDTAENVHITRVLAIKTIYL